MLAATQAGTRRTSQAQAETASLQDLAIGWIGAGTSGLHADGELVCAVDGTIYNAAALGGGDDAALIARLYREQGLHATLGVLNGDFAIAIYDARSGRLMLARDRFGVRPLYHLRDADQFAFASRPGPLLRLASTSRALDPRFLGLYAASHYRGFDNVPSDSPYEAIAQLPAGHLLTVADSSLELERWWRLEPRSTVGAKEAELAGEYRELLLDAVGVRVAASPAPAFTLSGGMDSSSVLASAVNLTGAKQHAYSTVYEGSEYDEREEIASMLDSTVEDWHTVAVNEPDVVETVSAMIDAHDEPVATATWLSHFLLCSDVAQGAFETLFGGLGGDELNAGEYEYFLYRFADLRVAGDERTLAHEVDEWVRHHDHPIFRKSFESMTADLERLVDLSTPGRIRPDRRRIERYADAIQPGVFDIRAWDPVLDTPFDSYLANRTYQDIFRETAPCCLRAEDRQTAAYGLANCDPFFDHRLAELMFGVGGELKIRDGVTKRLLREATVGILPDETRQRIKKTGWNAPADQWFCGPGRELLYELVNAPDAKAAAVYDLDRVRRLIDEHDEIVASGEPRENHMMFLWQLVNLELWLRWLDGLEVIE